MGISFIEYQSLVDWKSKAIWVLSYWSLYWNLMCHWSWKVHKELDM